MRSSSREGRELLRGCGALLLTTGAFVALIRESQEGSSWNDFDRMLVMLAPAALLYALALELDRPRALVHGGPGGAVQLVTAVLLTPLALGLFVTWSGAPSGALVTALLLTITAFLAVTGALRVEVPYAMLLGALLLAIAWLLVWSKILSHPSTDTFRWLLAAAAALLLAAGVPLARGGRLGGAEIAIAGGIAAVAAGVLGVLIGAGVAAVTQVFHSVPAFHVFGQGLAEQDLGWDVYLVVVSVALTVLGSKLRSRGLGYVGAFGLLFAVLSVGLRVSHLEHGGSVGHNLGAWPIVLIALGLLALLVPVFASRE